MAKFTASVKYKADSWSSTDSGLKWLAKVDVRTDSGSWYQWSRPCLTRWGAKHLAKRTARTMRRAHGRGELYQR